MKNKKLKITKERAQYLMTLPLNQVERGIMTGEISMKERDFLMGLEDFEIEDAEGKDKNEKEI